MRNFKYFILFVPSENKLVPVELSEVSVYEHSAAISNIYVDSHELITDDYDGIVILRSLALTNFKTQQYFKSQRKCSSEKTYNTKIEYNRRHQYIVKFTS
jgi:hypothetical protein